MLAVPTFNSGFHEDDPPNNPQANEQTVLQRAEALKSSDKELYSLIMGKGVSKGSKSVTEDRVKAVSDEQKTRYFDNLKKLKIQNVLKERAAHHGFMNPDDAIDFLSHKLNLSCDLEVVYADNDELTTIDDALKALAQRSPHLVTSTQRAGQGSVRPAADSERYNTNKKPVFTRSQLKDNKFFRANEEAINLAMKEGRVVDDIRGQ